MLLGSELVVDVNKEGVISRGCLQVDLTKAYNNLDWSFLVNILKAFDLPQMFVSWIIECVCRMHGFMWLLMVS